MPLPERNWKPYAIGFVITAAIVVAAWAVTSRTSVPPGSRDNAYASQVAIQGARVLAAESLMAGGLIYYRGQIQNQGNRTLTGYVVSLTFDDLYGRPLKTEQRSLLDKNQQPIPPHSTHSFEIGFDQFPAGWNQAPPTPHVLAVYVR
ncbi:MAG: hypothetical protein ACRD1C_06445 [Terriglobales bacterium]